MLKPGVSTPGKVHIKGVLKGRHRNDYKTTASNRINNQEKLKMVCRPFRTPKLMLPDRGLKTPGYNVFPFQGTVVDQIQQKPSKGDS